MPQPKTTVVDIVCTWHTGSTWLNLLLGANSHAFTVGESQMIRVLGRPVCVLHGERCPFWDRFDPASDENPYRQMARLAGKLFLIMKNSKRFHRCPADDDLEFRLIHLVRDGRAAAASYLRKHPEFSMRQAAGHWTHRMKRDLRYLSRHKPGPVMQVKYEDLQRDTPAALQRLCDFIQMPYEDSMLRYWEYEHHFLGGNRGTLSHMAKTQRPDVDLASAATAGTATNLVWNLDHYKQTQIQQFTDERWKRELTRGQLRMFGLIAGRMNHKLGYPRSIDRDA